MTNREELWYLIYGLIKGTYTMKIFCSEFTRIYNLEIDYDSLSADERHEFKDLCEMAERFSDDLSELEIPKMYFSEKQIFDKVIEIEKEIGRKEYDK